VSPRRGHPGVIAANMNRGGESMLALRNIFAGDEPARLKTYLILFIEY
jgi:hypothetical protein